MKFEENAKRLSVYALREEIKVFFSGEVVYCTNKIIFSWETSKKTRTLFQFANFEVGK